MKKPTLNNLCEQDRPAYKILNKGVYSLSDSELVAVLLKGNDPEIKAQEMARDLLTLVNDDLSRLARLSVTEMTQVAGITRNKAITLIAAIHLGRRRSMTDPSQRVKVGSSQDVVSHVQPLLQDLTHEEFWCLFLNRANRVVAVEKISSGGITGTVVDPKIIFASAIKHLASGIILTHNHPSGRVTPSDADISLTRKIADAGKLLDIQVLDHIIIAENSYYSFADEGKM